MGRPRISSKTQGNAPHVDEDLSPYVARYLCEQLLIDAVAVRDRGLLGKSDAYG